MLVHDGDFTKHVDNVKCCSHARYYPNLNFVAHSAFAWSRSKYSKKIEVDIIRRIIALPLVSALSFLAHRYSISTGQAGGVVRFPPGVQLGQLRSALDVAVFALYMTLDEMTTSDFVPVDPDVMNRSAAFSKTRKRFSDTKIFHIRKGTTKFVKFSNVLLGEMSLPPGTRSPLPKIATRTLSAAVS